jgi:WhiB family redox-sensing transcriptional regulator
LTRRFDNRLTSRPRTPDQGSAAFLFFTSRPDDHPAFGKALNEEVATVLEAPSLLTVLGSDIADAEDSGFDLPCRVQNPELWFADSPAELEVAKSHCADCPVRDSCLAGAMERHEPWGVWGGELFDHGVIIERKRPRGRPRKVVAA